jgi:N-carbamoyl-L-amino-acid hydrolase
MTVLPNFMSATVDEQRLARSHDDLAAFGRASRGGVNRPALSDADIAARQYLIERATAIGCSITIDPLGNLFMSLAGRDRSLAPVLTGSHTDTQPSGGRFDGAYGVLAGLEVLTAIQHAGIRTRRTIETVVWTNEEGYRFAPGCMGSLAFAYPAERERLLAATDSMDMTVGEAVARMRRALSDPPERPLGFPVSVFVEAHIEQGPILEQTGNKIGVVTGIQGKKRFEVTVIGEEAHAGTTPRARRCDALLAAARMVTALERWIWDAEDVARFTVGQFEVQPGSHAVVPGKVIFSIDFRHPDRIFLEEKSSRFLEICEPLAGGCTVSVHEIGFTPPIAFAEQVPQAVQRAAERRCIPWMPLLSGAGHDAQHLATVCPTGMIFVPCEKGVSHNEAENATSSDLATGARVLLDVLLDIANS